MEIDAAQGVDTVGWPEVPERADAMADLRARLAVDVAVGKNGGSPPVDGSRAVFSSEAPIIGDADVALQAAAIAETVGRLHKVRSRRADAAVMVDIVPAVAQMVAVEDELGRAHTARRVRTPYHTLALGLSESDRAALRASNLAVFLS